MRRQPDLRASDADREQVAERLRQAATEGRLGADELDERLGAALSARTYGELDLLVADLPDRTAASLRRSPETARLRSMMVAGLALTVALVVLGQAIGVLAGHVHPGDWRGGTWRGAPLIWLAWLALAWRVVARRRARRR